MTMDSKLREFTTSPNWWSLTIWGNGHTIETDPTHKGWRAARVSGTKTDAVLVGRRGVEGCFSARPVGDGRGQIDVAVYADTPEEVAKAWRVGDGVDAWYRFLDDVPGWGLEAIKLVEDEQRRFAQLK